MPDDCRRDRNTLSVAKIFTIAISVGKFSQAEPAEQLLVRFMLNHERSTDAAANSAGAGGIEVFNGSFAPVSLGTGAFATPAAITQDERIPLRQWLPEQANQCFFGVWRRRCRSLTALRGLLETCRHSYCQPRSMLSMWAVSRTSSANACIRSSSIYCAVLETLMALTILLVASQTAAATQRMRGLRYSVAGPTIGTTTGA